MADNDNKYIIRSMVNPILDCVIVADKENNGLGKVTAKAIFQKCGVPNANGHTFPKYILAKALEQIGPEIKARHFLGELDHPDDINDVNRIATVSLKSVSHVITDLYLDGDYVMGTFETLPTPNGSILAGLLKDNIKVGVSIRGITDQDISYGMGDINTIKDFNIISYDAVNNPAYSDAYVQSLVASICRMSDGSFKVKPLDVKKESTEDKTIVITADEFKDYTKLLTKAVLEAVYKNKK
jgi:hypothetical protein